jgi:hypothetical protein
MDGGKKNPEIMAQKRFFLLLNKLSWILPCAGFSLANPKIIKLFI